LAAARTSSAISKVVRIKHLRITHQI